MLELFAEVPDQTRTPAPAFSGIILDRLDSRLCPAAALPDGTPIDRPALGMQLTAEPLRGREDVPWNSLRTVTLVPDALQ
jgi:hypothetical protein